MAHCPPLSTAATLQTDIMPTKPVKSVGFFLTWELAPPNCITHSLGLKLRLHHFNPVSLPESGARDLWTWGRLKCGELLNCSNIASVMIGSITFMVFYEIRICVDDTSPLDWDLGSWSHCILSQHQNIFCAEITATSISLLKLSNLFDTTGLKNMANLSAMATHHSTNSLSITYRIKNEAMCILNCAPTLTSKRNSSSIKEKRAGCRWLQQCATICYMKQCLENETQLDTALCDWENRLWRSNDTCMMPFKIANRVFLN